MNSFRNPMRRSVMSSSRKPAHSESRLDIMWTISYLYSSSYFWFFSPLLNVRITERHLLLSLSPLLMKQVSKRCERTRYGNSFCSFENVILSCCYFWSVYQNMKMNSIFCCSCQLTKCWTQMRTHWKNFHAWPINFFFID